MVDIYLAGPLFSAAERRWNADVAEALRRRGATVHLPQEGEDEVQLSDGGKDLAARIFASDLRGIENARSVVACMDGADPDSGTCWECGVAYGKGHTCGNIPD
ncbi:MAG: nucleoside 2-deoxyribosyltransferase [Gemmatimonadetes bacterium]|nr:nucleoside 2-deoxyribosyltransferase [Gemmatimonadota bacterium]